MVIVHSYVAVYQRVHLPRESIVILLIPLMWIESLYPLSNSLTGVGRGRSPLMSLMLLVGKHPILLKYCGLCITRQF